jgi:hypothetical protein
MELNEKEINQLEKFKEKLEKAEEVKETKKRGRKKKNEEEKEMKVEKATQNVEVEKAVQNVEVEKPVEVENEKVSDKLKTDIEFRLIYWNDMEKEFDHLEYRIYKGIKKDLDEVKQIQKKILSLLGYDENNIFND